MQALEGKLAGQKRIKALEAERNEERRSPFDAQDQVDQRRDDLIARIEGKLPQHQESKRLLLVRCALE